ncbi:hypothetical protein Golomagni_06913 [Golovinomyces magnicellulatus]|nr:hypothetical protein Golomagni_06913 [Golovinomyces magnicellulatus]
MAAQNFSAGQDFTETLHHDTYPFIAESNHSGHTVMISGASRGIGKATALSFARSGASTIILAARSSLDELKSEIQSSCKSMTQPPTIITVSLDITSSESVDAAVAALKDHHVSSIDILINNAGAMEEMKPLKESDPLEWWKTWEVNIKGTYLVIHAFLDLVLASKAKTIVNVSSKGALYTRSGASAYGSSKAAILRFTQFLDSEYQEQGLLAFAIHPGSVPTDMSSRLPKSSHGILVDTTALAADTLAWLTQETRSWLGGRYVSVNWDMAEFLKKKDEVVAQDKLKLEINKQHKSGKKPEQTTMNEIP